MKTKFMTVLILASLSATVKSEYLYKCENRGSSLKSGKENITAIMAYSLRICSFDGSQKTCAGNTSSYFGGYFLDKKQCELIRGKLANEGVYSECVSHSKNSDPYKLINLIKCERSEIILNSLYDDGDIKEAEEWFKEIRKEGREKGWDKKNN